MDKKTRNEGLSEDEIGLKWDRCISDLCIKSVAGLSVGGIVSLVLFRRRSWPAVLGLGMGMGMAYSNCQNDFQRGHRYVIRSGPLPQDPSSSLT